MHASWRPLAALLGCTRPTMVSWPAQPPANLAAMQIMDTPHPNQVRRAQPEAEAANEEDAMELMEMILGALGECGTGWA